MNKDGGSAFPIGDMHGEGGMSLRDYFAAAAMKGLCANPDLSKYANRCGFSSENVRTDFARTAYLTADAMLKEREK